MRYREFAPGPVAGDVVVRYWQMIVADDIPDGFQHRVLPDGCLDLVVVLQGPSRFVVIRGPRDEPLLIPLSPGNRYWGIRVWPDAGALLLGVPAMSLIGHVGPADRHFGLAGAGLADAIAAEEQDEAIPAIIDAWLEPQIHKMPPLDSAVRLAILATNASFGSLGVESLARLVSLGPRQLQRRFREATGLTMKRYSRIRRLRRSIAHLVIGPERSWGEVASTLGFADQSHLISEFTRLAGAKPREIAAYVAGIEHVDVVP
jgi:AraC-like DNA-binding protein